MKNPAADLRPRHVIAGERVGKNRFAMLRGQRRHFRRENVAEHSVFLIEPQPVAVARFQELGHSRFVTDANHYGALAYGDLAREAGNLKSDTVLTAWLYAVTRRTAVDVIRKESRRQLREQIAVEMNNMNAAANDWTQIEPLLDDAMAALDETDRSAILLRYFENKSLREVTAIWRAIQNGDPDLAEQCCVDNYAISQLSCADV